ncbi:hypothetical protein [Pseudomonas aeruginosa]|uniref:hypothetical protein n=1 Tax=Pseudomonas aeruginosa TaxID=287 RepID=UPI000F521AB1|nr:hypothetical protein [Pseudomonas aeruginosa]MBO2832838.1 hypothetical protein [Pseudomonas aeruginosa]
MAFMMPAHPRYRSPADGHFHDLDTLQFFDRTGFAEAWVGEHYMMPGGTMPLAGPASGPGIPDDHAYPVGARGVHAAVSSSGRAIARSESATLCASPPGAKLVGEEDKGGGLLAAVSLLSSLPYGIARWYPLGLEGQVRVDFDCEYTGGSLYLNGVEPGDNAYVVDDLISTGGTLVGLVAAIRRAGASVLGMSAWRRRSTTAAQSGSAGHRDYRPVACSGGRLG